MPPTRRSEWLRPNVLWAIAGGVVGYLIGHWLGNVIASGYQQTQGASDLNDVAIVLGLSLGVAGWMAGIGGLNYPLAKVLGFELAPNPPECTRCQRRPPLDAAAVNEPQLEPETRTSRLHPLTGVRKQTSHAK